MMRVRRVLVSDWAQEILKYNKRDVNAELLALTPTGTVILGQVHNAPKQRIEILIENSCFEQVRLGDKPPVHPVVFTE
jgi:hypothetical protein